MSLPSPEELQASGYEPVPAPANATRTGVPGRVELDTAAARTLITPALLAELGRRLYEYENAITWNTSCLGCAAKMDQDYALTMRAEQAEERLAALRSVLLEGGQDAGTVRRRALTILGSEEGTDRG